MSWPEVWDYILLNINHLYQDVPNVIILVIFLITIVAFVLTISIKDVKHKVSVIGLIVLVDYFFLLLCITVIFRAVHDSQELNLKLFWSYHAFLEGKNYVMAEKIMNCLMFIPVGFLLGCVLTGINWKKVLLIAVVASLSIESLQYILSRGYAELDDVFHNTIGCMIGFGIYSLLKMLFVHSAKGVKLKC